MIRRTGIVVLEVAALVAAALAVVVGLMAWRLSSGPISIDFLTPYLEAALGDRESGYVVKVGTTVITWAGWNRTIEMRALDLKATDGTGKVLAAVRELNVRLSPRALLLGRIAPTRLEVLHPRLRLIRHDATRFAFAPRQGENSGLLPLLLRGVPEARRRGLRRLEEIRVVDGELVVEDRHLGRTWRVPNVYATLGRDDRGLSASLVAEVAMAGRTTRFDATGHYDLKRGNLDLTLSFSGLEPAAFAERDSGLAVLAALKVPLDGKITLAMDDSGRVGALGFEFKGARGTIAVPEPFGQLRHLPVVSLEAKGRLLDGLRRLVLDDVAIIFDGPTLSAQGEVKYAHGKGDARLRLIFRDLPVDEFGRYWPVQMATPARRWVVDNLRDGIFREFAVDLKGGWGGGANEGIDLRAVDGVVTYENMTVSYMASMPPARKVRGAGTMDLDGFNFSVNGGTLEGLSIDRATGRLDGFRQSQQHARVSADLHGDLRRVLKIIDRKPFHYAKRLGIDVGQVHGEMAARLNFDFPLIDALELKDVKLNATANLRQVVWRGALLGVDAENGDLSLTLDKHGMSIKGGIRVAGTPTDLVWRERFGSGKGPRRTMTLSGRFDEAARARLGFDVGRVLQGPLGASFKLYDGKRKSRRLDVALDFRETAIDLSALGCRKDRGQPAKGDLRVIWREGRDTEISAFSIEAPTLAARGSARLGPGGGIATVVVPRLTCGATILGVKVAARGDGGYDVRVSGDRLDASGLMRRTPDKDRMALPRLTLAGRVASMRFAPGRHLGATSFDGEYDGLRWRRLRLDGALGQGGKLAIRFEPQGKGRRLTVTSDNAGAVLRTLDLADDVVGGRLAVNGTIADIAAGDPFIGKVRIQKFKLVRAPALAQMLTLSSQSGVADRLGDKKGILFSKLVMPFTYENDVIKIKRGRAVGSELGITVGGNVDLVRDELALSGTLVPAYTLNSVLGKIPVVGRILVGEKGSGVFAAIYDVNGTLDQPKITVNPLAVLTPGFLRGLFDIFSRNRSQSSESPVEVPEEMQ